MDVEIRIPEVGESVSEAVLAEWFKADGDPVRRDEALFLLETDKITLEVPAGADGILRISVAAGASVGVGDVVGTIAAESAAGTDEGRPEPAADEEPSASVETAPGEPKAGVKPLAAGESAPADRDEAGHRTEAAATSEPEPTSVTVPAAASSSSPASATLSPSVRRLVAQEELDPATIPATGPGGRLTKGDVILFLEERSAREATAAPVTPAAAVQASPEARRRTSGEGPPVEDGTATTRKPMSPIRKRIAQRLLEARQGTAMLTTFNEVDMSRVQALRAKFKEAFREKHGVSLGIASFFLKALVEALKEFPELNAFIEGDTVVYHHEYHIGVAVGAERGLVVPVIRNAETLGLAEIERSVGEYVNKIRANRLQLSDLEGGTFTITNGGVFGSLLSTPILNPPQSGILGLHKIEDRPVVADGEVVVRPMMYVALSYDHRLVDGRQAVQFLVRIKEEVEDPERLLVEV